MTDIATLIHQTRDGDTNAFAEVVRRFQDMAMSYAYSLLHDLQLAEDVAQEAFLDAYLCLPQLRDPAAFPGWFRRIVFKQCDRVLRKQGLVVVPLEAEVETSARQLSQVEEFEQREMKDQVWAAIDTLPEHERTPVLLYYMGGHSQKEVAAFLGVPETAIKKRLFSARQRLRENLMDFVVDTLREHRPSRDTDFATSVIEMLKAAREGDLQMVRTLLLQNKQLLTARDWLGNSALIVAVNSGHQAIAELLFKSGVRPDVHEAAAIGQTERVEKLINEDRVRLNSFSAEGFTPLALAAHFGHRETTELLINQGADINLVSRHPVQVTPLHAALFGKQVETARTLIEHGADVNIKRGGAGWPRAGWTALHYAAGFGFTELIPLLVASGADKQLVDEQQHTPLAVAVEEGQEEAAKLLR
jgi:RNA polymerase sigma factor (sigma-70 family)